MIDFCKIKELLPVVPDEFVSFYDDFQQFYTEYGKTDFLQNVTDTLVFEKLMPPDNVDYIHAQYRAVAGDDSLNCCLWFLYYVMKLRLSPWNNHLHNNPLPESLGDDKYCFPLILMLRILYDAVVQLRALGIEDSYIESMHGVFSYATFDCTECQCGIKNLFNWHISSAYGLMHQIGRLKYEPKAFENDFILLSKDGRFTVIFAKSMDVNSDGQFCRDGEPVAFTTSFSQTDDAFFAHPVIPDGRISPDKKEYKKSEYQVEAAEGDMVLAVHIPSGPDYTPEKAKESYYMALDFYKKYFPQFRFKAFVCYSWLYSPQLSVLLPPNSGINRYNKTLYICPSCSDESAFHTFVFRTNSFCLESAPTDTYLRKSFVEFKKQGKRANVGFYFLPVSFLDSYGCDISLTSMDI